MTDNTPTDPPAAEGDPDEKTVVRPRRRAQPVADETPAPAPALAPAVAPMQVVPEAPAAPAYAAPVAQPAPQVYYRAPQPPKGLSLASMLLGIGGLLLSFFGVGFLINVAAVVTGHLAVKRQPYAKGFWLTGIVTGYVGIAFSLVYGVIWARYFLSLLT